MKFYSKWVKIWHVSSHLWVISLNFKICVFHLEYYRGQERGHGRVSRREIDYSGVKGQMGIMTSTLWLIVFVLFLKFHCIYLFCAWMYAFLSVYMWGWDSRTMISTYWIQRTASKSQFSSSTRWVSGTECLSSGLWLRTSTHWVILLISLFSSFSAFSFTDRLLFSSFCLSWGYFSLIFIVSWGFLFFRNIILVKYIYLFH